MNTQLLNEVAGDIEASPDRYDQTAWGSYGFDPLDDDDTACGCVAAFTVAHAVRKGNLAGRLASTESRGRLLLDLDVPAAGALFDPAWPVPWLTRAGLSVDDVDAEDRRRGADSFHPVAAEAAAICRAMAKDGRVWGGWPTYRNLNDCPTCDGAGGENHQPCPDCERVA